MSDTIELNGKQLTIEQFEEEKKKLQEQNIKIVEIKNNIYRTRLED